MKKFIPYIILFVLFLVAGILIISNRKNAPRKFNEHITLRHHDKLPYGTSIARSLLPSLFPEAAVYQDFRQPGTWDSILYSSYNQAVVLMTKDFEADEEELTRLLYFAQQGNYVFIIARNFSREASNFFNFSFNSYALDDYLNLTRDSLSVHLEQPVFDTTPVYVYPGKRFESAFTSLDTAHSVVLGRNRDELPNFIQLKTGNGRIFIHLAPLAFSNYFILHKNNIEYYQKALSVIPVNVHKVLWNEYYLVKPAMNKKEDEPNLFRVLLKYEEFRWGLLTGLILLALYMLLGSRRKQRKIPPYGKPRNDSLDFVKTLGRLYHDRRDHGNLARKMSIYFLDHVRTRYKLSTAQLDDPFIQSLHVKSGYDEGEIRNIVSFIRYLEGQPPVSDEDLYRYHKQLQMFYQNT